MGFFLSYTKHYEGVHMKKRFKRILTFLLSIGIILASVCLFSLDALACTGVYVGSEVSADGSFYIARSNDMQRNYASYVHITERVENESGRTMAVDYDGTVFSKLPATTYRCISTPFMDSSALLEGKGTDAAICTNEYGVSMSFSITAFSNDAALKADPLVEQGITEFRVTDLVVCQSATAREATEKLASLIDEFGSAETGIALIADQQEVWYVEMYNGHQYAAVKLPKDKVCVLGNEFSLEYVSDYEDYILSPKLESVAKENGFAVYGKNNELNILETYSGHDMFINYSHMRTWIGRKVLAPNYYGEYEKNTVYPLCFSPEKKVSTQDVMDLMRNRYENTEYSPDETGRKDMRVIGSDTALSVHIAQIYPDLDPDMSTVIWESIGPAVYGVFVPISSGVNSISEAYDRNQSVDDAGTFDTNTYPYFRFKAINTLCVEKENCVTYGQPVRAYWHEAETQMIDTMDLVIENAKTMEHDDAHNYITAYCSAVQEKAFKDSGYILNNLMWSMSENSNTMKNERDPKTHEVLNQLKELTPMEVKLDAVAYSQIPSDEDIYGDVSEDVSVGSFAPKGASGHTTALGILAAILVFGIIIAIVIFFGIIAWR